MASPSDRLARIPRSGIREVFDLARGIPNLIHLELGEPDFRMPDHVAEAAIQAVRDGFTKYTPNAGVEELREAIAEKLKRENGIEADPNGQIIVTAGAMEALSMSVLSTVNPGDEVIIPDPGYASYAAEVLLAEGIPISAPLQEENDFRLTADDLEKVVTRKTRLVILNSPSNPTGSVESNEDLKGIADFAKDHGTIVISDEPYERIVYEKHGHRSIAALPEMFDRTISIFSFSKTYAMTGMRIGYMTSNLELIRQMTKLQEHYVACVNSVAQRAAIAAFRGPQSCVDMMISEYQHRRDLLVDGLNATGLISCRKPAGTFYAFPNISKIEEDSRDLAAKLVDVAKVVTVPGAAFGPHGEGHLRLSFATSLDNLREAVARISEYCIRIRLATNV